MSQMREVVTVLNDKEVKIGRAMLKKDGTIKVYLDAFPINGILVIK